MQAAEERYLDDLEPPLRLPYLRGLDGLRAIAVIAVVLYHAEVPWARGGFLGVEVFFVISGYLITSLLLLEWLRDGRVDMKRFWIRRARRLLPAVALLLVTVALAVTLFYRDGLNRLAEDVGAALGYFTNWFLIVKDVSYFDSFARPSLLQHLWSLSVEEQFYVLWPIVFSVGFWLLRSSDRRRTIRSFLVVTVLGIATSTILMAVLFTPFDDPSRVYYGTDTRAAGILVGVATALLAIPWRAHPDPTRRARTAMAGVGWASLVTLIVILATMDEFSAFLYRGGFLLTSLVTAGLIVAAVSPARVFGPLLDNPLTQWIGTRSYGIYLWHWPVFMVTRPGVEVADRSWLTFALRLSVTLVIAEISYRLVEMPIRRNGLRAWGRGLATVLRPSGTALRGLAGALLLLLALGSATVVLGLSGSPDAVAGVSDPSKFMVTSSLDATTDTAAVVTEALPAPGNRSLTVPDFVLDRVQTEVTTTTVEAMPPAPLPSITFIGDSVMYGARHEVTDEFPNTVWVDALENRQFSAAKRIVERMRDRDELGDVVVLHLGTNGPFSADEFDTLLTALADRDRVVLVTAKVPRRWEETVNRTIAEGADRWEIVEVFDWHTLGNENPQWFYSDRVHLNGEGKAAYADALSSFLATGS